MTKTRLLSASLLAGAALIAPQAASAQEITRVVSFGDSTVDTGNALAIVDATVGLPPSAAAVYPTGRFSGGLSIADTLAEELNASLDDFAIGGALTDNSNTNAGLPGFATQYSLFLNGGAGFPIPGIFPSVSGTFESDDLVLLSLGGNDGRIYQQTGGDVAGAAVAGATSAAQASFGLNTLIQAGAQNISYIAIDTSTAPEVAFQPDPANAAAVRSAFASSYNAGIQTTLAGFAANGVMVHYLDGNQVVENILANPEFGIGEFACPLFVVDTACVVDSSNYVIYGDALHPTTATNRVIAEYIAAQLNAPLTIDGNAMMAMDNARHFGRTLTARIDGTAPRDGDMAEGFKIYAGGDYSSRGVTGTMWQNTFDTSAFGIHGGVEVGVGNFVVGGMARYAMPKFDYGNRTAEGEATSIEVGGYAAYALGPIYLQGYVGAGWDDHEIERAGVRNIDALSRSAEFDGDHFVYGGKIGYLLNAGIFRVGPSIAYDYAKVDLDGYTESGDAALNLNVDPIDFSSGRGSLGIDMRGDFDNWGIQVRPHARFAFEKNMGDSMRMYRFSQTTSPGIVNSWNLGEEDDGLYGRLSGGFSAQLFSSVRLDTAVSMTFEKDDGNETGASVSLNVGF
ncbi:autotransporter domain-containing protein [Sphingomicrobium clamense]|uniref:Autotransporter domain-containing protein n=1 Tax=Sphingomicrobium clamense TaxID=2851013 RepID=A0ABS6V3X0_9SPHN|nr:autotransporter domain-containing protein [Sphingomicrobium sp. B8]MBW0144253.1 autotransporter domain-containing protein [Sphingomicrobium sp. B8]